MDVEVIEEAHVPDQPAKKYNFKRRKCSYGKPIQKKSKTYARYKQQREEEDEAENSADENVGMAPPPIRLDDDVPEVLTEWSTSILNQMMPPVKKKRADGNWRTDRAVQARDRQLENERKKREAERKAAQKKLDAQKKKRKAAEEKAKKASEKTAAKGGKLETEKKLRIAAEKKV